MAHEIVGVEHVGIAVADIATALDTYAAMGFVEESVEDLPDQGFRSHIVRCGETRLELLESTDPRASLHRYLETHGEGLHHLCLQVRSIEDTMAAGNRHGLRFTSSTPSVDRRGWRVFVHPKSANGVLIGLVQPHENGSEDA